MSIQSMSDTPARNQAPTVMPVSRKDRDQERSIHAEAIARELAFAVYRAPWYALESWQQIRLMNTAVMAIRSLDPHARGVARARAVASFQDDRGGAVLPRVSAAIEEYMTHLTFGPDEERPTAAEDAAYAKGIARDDDDALTGHGRY